MTSTSRHANIDRHTYQVRLMVVSDPNDAAAIAGELRVAVGLLVRQLRRIQRDATLTAPEISALSHLDRDGPMPAADLARRERISPQSMGATLAKLEARGLIGRHADLGDGRRIILSLTSNGRSVLIERRGVRDEVIAHALSSELTESELDQLRAAVPLLERLARRFDA